MTTYKEIKGTQIEVVSSDPSNPVEGQVWYNSTDQAVKGETLHLQGLGQVVKFKYVKIHSWWSLNKDASLVFGGIISTGNIANTESYNGSSWTEVNNLNDRKRILGMVELHLLFCGGGESPGQTENV